MRELNWHIILGNIQEAREELVNIEREVQKALSHTGQEARGDDSFGEVELRIAMQHAYHHLNFAWNIRHETSDRYSSLTHEDFEKWGAYPSDLDWL